MSFNVKLGLSLLLSFFAHGALILLGTVGLIGKTSADRIHSLFQVEVAPRVRAPTQSAAKTKSRAPGRKVTEVASSEEVPNSSEVSDSPDVEPTPYAEHELDRKPRLISRPALNYPPRARQLGLEGDVTLALIVDSLGHVRDAKVIQTTGSDFDRAALDAAYQLHFEPGTKQGQPVSVSIQWMCRFRLD